MPWRAIQNSGARGRREDRFSLSFVFSQTRAGNCVLRSYGPPGFVRERPRDIAGARYVETRGASLLNMGRPSHYLEIATAHENTPGNFRKLVGEGERDGKLHP